MTLNPAASAVVPIENAGWTAEPPLRERTAALSALEAGDVLFFPTLRFEVEPDEVHVFSPAITGSSKNVAFDPANGKLAGATLTGDDLRALAAMVARFSAGAAALVDRVLPSYR